MMYFTVFLAAFLPFSILLAAIAQKIQEHSYARFKKEGVWPTRDDLIVDTIAGTYGISKTHPSAFPLIFAALVSLTIVAVAIISY